MQLSLAEQRAHNLANRCQAAELKLERAIDQLRAVRELLSQQIDAQEKVKLYQLQAGETRLAVAAESIASDLRSRVRAIDRTLAEIASPMELSDARTEEAGEAATDARPAGEVEPC
ncbi:hypothetical protein [Oceanibaculum nanhaiense]|uniref:hypothetical protein n=1 Tax=Oceanibaculum nanhaiense TaxID=1909734 RepID=UPI003D2E03B0